MNKTQFFQRLRQLVATDDIKTALRELRTFLEHSPRLNEAILQTSRFQVIQKQIHLGVVRSGDYSEAANGGCEGDSGGFEKVNRVDFF